jgi:hypothetical protein
VPHETDALEALPHARVLRRRDGEDVDALDLTARGREREREGYEAEDLEEAAAHLADAITAPTYPFGGMASNEAVRPLRKWVKIPHHLNAQILERMRKFLLLEGFIRGNLRALKSPVSSGSGGPS